MSDSKRSKITEVHIDEAARLKSLWDDGRPRMTQAEFGEHYKLGNQANVGHYLSGRSPLNLRAAMAFANELKCDIADFSPRLAAEVQLLPHVVRGDPEGPKMSETLSDRLRMVFDARPDLTQIGLARACGISRASVNAWHSGKTESIDGKFLTTAAAYLNVAPHWLSTGKGPMAVQFGSLAEEEGVGVMAARHQQKQAPSLYEAVKEAVKAVESLSPLLQPAGQSAIEKWMHGRASREETSSTLAALAKANQCLNGDTAVESPSIEPSSQGRYACCESMGLIHGKSELTTRWVLDRESGELLHVQALDGLGQWYELDDDVSAELMEGLLYDDALNHPEEFKIEFTSELPDWAQELQDEPQYPRER